MILKSILTNTAIVTALSLYTIQPVIAQDFDFTGITQLPSASLSFTSSDDFIHVDVIGKLTNGEVISTSNVGMAIHGLGTDAPGVDTTDMDNAGNTSLYQEGWDRMEFTFDEPVTLNSISFSTWEAGTLVMDDDAADVYALVDGQWILLGRAETLNLTDITTTISTSSVHSVYYTHHFNSDIEASQFAIQVPELTSGQRPIEFRVAALNVSGTIPHECKQDNVPDNAEAARIMFTDATPYPAPWMNFFSEDTRVEVNVKALFTRDLDYVAIPSAVTRLIHGLGSKANGESTDMDNIGNTLVHTEGWDRLEFTFDQAVSIDNISFSTWERNNWLMDDDAADIYAFVNGVWEFVDRAETSSRKDLKWYIEGTNILSRYYTHEFNNSPVASRFAIQVPELRTGQRPIEFRVAAMDVTPAEFRTPARCTGGPVPLP
ncbi:MAG: hypothetical protein HRU20_18900 [Pseudomonadales bacterium]|nr:hypothetical protein [Pseudomonadales bacterium]